MKKTQIQKRIENIVTDGRGFDRRNLSRMSNLTILHNRLYNRDAPDPREGKDTILDLQQVLRGMEESKYGLVRTSFAHKKLTEGQNPLGRPIVNGNDYDEALEALGDSRSTYIDRLIRAA
tara:strand:- start:6706 stop:7065 length:360 start_codon:yes stop_codon:yes gene_type:complete